MLSQAPAVVPPAPVVPSIGISLVQPVQMSNVSEKAWNEIVEFGDSEEFFFMISESNALQHNACKYDGSDDDEFGVQIADKHSLRCRLKNVFSEWAALVQKTVKMSDVSFFKAAVNPGAPGHLLASASDDDEVDSDDGGKVDCSPTWASLDNHILVAQSMTIKSKFNGDALHDDRIRIHQGINCSIQLCVTDSQGRLLAIPSEAGWY